MGAVPQTCVIVMGVSGSGKSTVGRVLAEVLGFGFIEGDELHPPENRSKMASGTPLTDSDRWPWLDAITQTVQSSAKRGESVVVACSALRRRYRDRLRAGCGADIRIVYLEGSRGVLASRLGRRRGHFMPGALLDSQLATLEPPGADELPFVADIAQAPSEIARKFLTATRIPPRTDQSTASTPPST